MRPERRGARNGGPNPRQQWVPRSAPPPIPSDPLPSETLAPRNQRNRRRGSAPSVLPSLVQEIQEKLVKGGVECMICYDMVRRSSPIWSCCSCYSIFHLYCIKKWAKSPTSADFSADVANWRCPGCQFVHVTPSKDLIYSCFCSRRKDPPSDPYLIPHTCGEPCGKPLDRGAHSGDDDFRCPHVCVLQCHPGPCPPCKAFARERQCPCGKQTLVRRCSDHASPLTCGRTCEKLLPCIRHKCDRVCHVGPCEPCRTLITASCFCKKKEELVLCGEMSVKGDLDQNHGIFSCNCPCGKALNCGNHLCCENCHPGPCGECKLQPGKVKTCHCGKKEIQVPRKSCLDPIPTCEQICGKFLRCGIHSCKVTCHAGDCPPCSATTVQKCRCGSTSREVECFKASNEAFLCEKPCGRKKSCGRHRCSERCCGPSDWDPHVCTITCGKKLRCGQHTCQSLCHSGHCSPCMETIFTELSCACGKTSIPPPQPCGTPYPSCQHMCEVPQPCGHRATHTCHFGDCPPCSLPMPKECVGGHVVLRNIPCGSRDIRCNQLCGKTRRCGLHACGRTCHPSPCDSPSSSSSCGQVCGASRRDCRHTCAHTCHPSSPCPEVKCEFPVTITCSCGRITSSGVCGEGERKVLCDEECARQERKRMLAEAFDVAPLHLGENSPVPEVVSDAFRREPKWVMAVEERLKALVLGKSRASGVKVHVFCPMVKEKRDAVRALAERWKLAVHAAGWEPRRFLVVRVTPKSKAPAKMVSPKMGGLGPVLDLGLDMDPRLVVALYELPDEGDISALVLRFGGECELVWLGDKNALAVFSDPARAATALRRLDRGSQYHSAAVLLPSPGVSRMEGPGKKAVVGKEVAPWGLAGPTLHAWATDHVGQPARPTLQARATEHIGPVGPAAVVVNRWSALDSDAEAGTSASELVVDDWENLTE